MDSRQSLEFIARLIERSETDPRIRATLKKATLMHKMAEAFSGVDDGHLENLYRMNTNKGGASLFLQTLEKALQTKGLKAPKEVVVQAHPNFVRKFEKYFSSTVPFAVKGSEWVVEHWNGDVEKKQKGEMGFYNDLSSLTSYLQSLGVVAPFEIKAKKNTLVITCVQENLDIKNLFSELMLDAETLASKMVDEEKTLEILVELDEKISSLGLEITGMQKESQRKTEKHQALRAEATQLEMTLDRTPVFQQTEELTQSMVTEAKKLADAEWKSLKEFDKKLAKRQSELSSMKTLFDRHYEKARESQSRIWKALDWGSSKLSEEQVRKLIYILGSKYKPLLQELPAKKTITVEISCVISSTSKGFKEANFSHLKDFIKLTIF